MLPIDTRRWPSAFQRLAYFIIGLALLSAALASAFWWGGILGSFLAMPTLPILVLSALAVALGAVVDGWRIRKQPRRALTVIGITIFGICLSPVLFVVVFRSVDGAFTWGTLAAKYPSYVQVIDRAAHGDLPPPAMRAWQTWPDGTDFEAERAPPHRVAFPLPGGFLNNWQGILYDPNGVGQRVHAIQPDGAPGDLLDNWWTIGACSHMIGRFYKCDFS